MTFADFTGLNQEQKIDAIWEWGFYLGKFRSSEKNRILYSLNGYFAEMQLAADGKVTEVKPVKELDDRMLSEFALSKDNPFVAAASLQDQEASKY